MTDLTVAELPGGGFQGSESGSCDGGGGHGTENGLFNGESGDQRKAVCTSEPRKDRILGEERDGKEEKVSDRLLRRTPGSLNEAELFDFLSVTAN
ncbi:hypothetical protein F2Q69_00008059 [Brassica cretica]|uniref:Uncharacterized protein n=1 Tax=Brassica cretica TaxID=69181 RepID=A0A8S9NQQ5_BRACR|nr:hypothetical protein F2Q69_00008059 [Brassica cretica]